MLPRAVSAAAWATRRVFRGGSTKSGCVTLLHAPCQRHQIVLRNVETHLLRRFCSASPSPTRNTRKHIHGRRKKKSCNTEKPHTTHHVKPLSKAFKSPQEDNISMHITDRHWKNSTHLTNNSSTDKNLNNNHIHCRKPEVPAPLDEVTASRPEAQLTSKAPKHHLRPIQDSESVLGTVESITCIGVEEEDGMKSVPHEKWSGLSGRRRWKIRQSSTADSKSLSYLQNFALDAAFQSSFEASNQPIRSALTFYDAAKAHRGPTPFRLSDASVLGLIDRTLVEATREDSIVKQCAKSGDLACETLFRCIDLFQVRPSVNVLSLLLRTAARDPVVERRAEKALSIFRFSRSAQLMTSPEFMYECFSTCVSGLDVECAAVMMEFALQSRLYYDPKSSESGPFEIDYYNGVMHAALLTGDHNTAQVVHNEVVQRGLQPNVMADSIFLALCFERGDERTARVLLGAMQKKTGRLEDCVFAAMLRSAGRKRDTGSVIEVFKQFKKQGNPCSEVLLNMPYQGVNGSWSVRASAAARGDPTYALFQALRVCTAPEEAVRQLQYLKKEYGMRVPRALYALVIETCCKGCRLDLAKKIRIEMEAAHGMKRKR